VVHHYPYPYPEYYHGDRTAGFRNPGGVGRYLEYYPPGNQFQERGDPVRVARFDQGGGAPDRAEQIAAQQLGVQKDRVMLNHIDNYARPYMGYGFATNPYDQHSNPNTPPLSHSFDHSANCSDAGYDYPTTPLSMPGSPNLLQH